MAQVLKQMVRESIKQAALKCFAHQGYRGTPMAAIAAAAGTAPANVYRYFDSKAALFDAVVPKDLPKRHDRLLETRVSALASQSAERSTAAAELLDFWVDNRLAVVILLDRAAGTPHADYPARFVRRLVKDAERTLPRPPSPAHREVLGLVFDNTRRALAEMLRSADDRDHTRALIEAFWSYQLPGLAGLMAFIEGGDGQS